MTFHSLAWSRRSPPQARLRPKAPATPPAPHRTRTRAAPTPIRPGRTGPRQRSTAAGARERILAAAAAVFAHKGFYGGTIEDVARQAGYSPAALYKHFGSRDALFGELWQQVAGVLGALFERAAGQQGRFETRLRWLVQELAGLLESAPDLVAAFLTQRPYAAQDRRTALERASLAHYRRHVAQLTALMESGVREGAIRAGRAEAAAILFKGLLYEFAYRWITAETPPDLSLEVDLLLELLERGAGRPGRGASGS